MSDDDHQPTTKADHPRECGGSDEKQNKCSCTFTKIWLMDAKAARIAAYKNNVPNTGDAAAGPLRELPKTLNDLAAAFEDDGVSLVFFKNGTWVCREPDCLHPISRHPDGPPSPPVIPPTFALGDDATIKRLHKYFGRVQSSASSKSGFPPDVADATFVSRCVLCGYTGGKTTRGYPLPKATPPVISRAHIVSDKDVLEECRLSNHEGNYLPLCGSKGWNGTCHDAFDKRLLMLVYIGDTENDGTYMIVASQEPYKTYLHGRKVHLSTKVPRKVLQAHALMCLDTRQVEPQEDILSQIRVTKWSPEQCGVDEGEAQ